MRRKQVQWLAAAALPLLLVAGCKSRQIQITLQNHTGNTLRLLEVDYPNASFGADTLSPGAVMHYGIQVMDDGPLTLQYQIAEGHTVHNNGPGLHAKQEGALEIVLLPDGKAEFHPAAH